ncbi:MAG TPA: NAD-dependent epimerase/dehydratase family protein [Polyangiaceae bacterium]
MRILLIGATGFIGPFVVAELRRAGHELAVFHRSASGARSSEGVRQFIGDRSRLLDARMELRAFAPEIIIDMILSSGRQARELLDVFRGAARRVVALSSMDVYRACGVVHGFEPGPLEPLPLTEGSALRTKLQTYPPEQIAVLKKVFGWVDDDYDKIPVERAVLGDPELEGTVLRLPMVYGPGDPLHRFFPWVKRIADGRPVMLFAQSMADWRGTKGYVENVAAAIALAAVRDDAAARVYNVGEADAPSELDWAHLVAQITGWHGELRVLPDDRVPPHLRAPGNAAQHWVAESKRIRDELGYREPISRDEALRRTVEWEKAHPPESVDFAQFDYAAEDEALRN